MGTGASKTEIKNHSEIGPMGKGGAHGHGSSKPGAARASTTAEKPFKSAPHLKRGK